MGQNVSLLMPEDIAKHHDGYLARYASTGEKHVVGATREVSVVCKDGRRLVCELKVNELNVAGERSYIGLLVDVTKHKELLETMAEVSACVSRWAWFSFSWPFPFLLGFGW